MRHSFWITQNTRRDRRYERIRSNVTVAEIVERVFEQDEEYRDLMEVNVVSTRNCRVIYTMLFKCKKLVAGHGDCRFEYLMRNHIGFHNDEIRLTTMLEELETY